MKTKTLFLTKEKAKIKEEQLLSKKRASPDTPKKDIDMVKLKEKINEIMNRISTPNISDENNYLYLSMHKNYLLNEFTSNCLNYINKIIINVKKNHLKKSQGMLGINEIFVSTIKELLMNEFEILLLSLYLESIDITLFKDLYSFQESLIYLCYFIKTLTLTPKNLLSINSFLIRKYQGFEDKFDKWLQLNSMILNNKCYFSYIEINQRFKEYNVPYSVYCKNNFIDYNLIIDRILTMSIPYNESKKDNITKDNKDKSNNSILDTKESKTKDFNKIKNNNFNEIFFTTNNDLKKINNNKDNSFYNSNYNESQPTGIFLSANNNFDINSDYLYNRNNIITNKINKFNNNELITPQINNNKFIPIKLNESNNKNAFKINNLNNCNNIFINNNSYLNDNKNNSRTIANKVLLKEEECGKQNIVKANDEGKKSIEKNDDNILNNEKKFNKKEISITPINLLYSLDNENNYYINPNIHIDNCNLIEKMYNQIKNENNKINNNNLMKNNDRIDVVQPQNNIINFNNYQQINDFNALKYNNNLGINDYNPSSQISLFSSDNPYFTSNNYLYHSSVNGIGQDENMKFYQSKESFLKNYISNSSKNIYQINDILNMGNNNIGNNGNIINNNFPNINQFIANNSPYFNLNKENYGKNNIFQEKKFENNENKEISEKI